MVWSARRILPASPGIALVKSRFGTGQNERYKNHGQKRHVPEMFYYRVHHVRTNRYHG